MARQRKSKIFELLSSDFKVTDFYKPTGTEGDMHYYVTIDDLIRLRMQVVNRVVVIDGAETITTTYIKPIYEKLIKTIMSQQELTVLVSLLGHTYVMQQACIACGAPIVDDERYITVARSYYNKMKKKYNGDNSKYGFYILSVSDDDMKDEPAEASSVNQTPIGVEPPISKATKLLLTNLKPVFPDVKTESASTDSIRCYLGNGVDFVVEVVNGDIYIKDLLLENVHPPQGDAQTDRHGGVPAARHDREAAIRPDAHSALLLGLQHRPDGHGGERLGTLCSSLENSHTGRPLGRICMRGHRRHAGIAGVALPHQAGIR